MSLDLVVLDVPGDFLDNVPDEFSSLAEMTFHARDARLWLARGDFLYGKESSADVLTELCACWLE